MPCGATQEGWVMVERSDRVWSTGEGNGKPLQYSCLERWLRRGRRAKRNYSTFKVRRGGCEEIPLVQGKEQWLCLAEAAVKRYPTSKVRETHVRGRCCKTASEGRHTESIITENQPN